MSIESVFHAILSSDSNPAALTLSALLPADRIVTGMSHERDMPYASINLESDLPEYRSNQATMRQPRIRFQCWVESHTKGCQIRQAVCNLFENKTFSTDQARVNTRIENTLAIQEEDGVWQFLIDIETQFQTILPTPTS